MDWLTSLPVGLLVIGSLVFTVSVALAARVGVRRLDGDLVTAASEIAAGA